MQGASASSCRNRSAGANPCRPLLRGWLRALYGRTVTPLANRRVRWEKIRNVLFVAHPDDELLFFSGQLQQRDRQWLVVAMSGGDRPTRAREFRRATRAFGAQALLLSLPDGRDIRWDPAVLDARIAAVLGRVPRLEAVYTHNREGEYGHAQHIQLHAAVLRQGPAGKTFVPLTDDLLFTPEHRLPDDASQHKLAFFSTHYPSQAVILTHKNQYFQYEGWRKADTHGA